MHVFEVNLNNTGLEISWSQGSLELSCGSLRYLEEPKDALFDIHNTFIKLMMMQLGSLE